jgi:hypothetical protein
LRHRTAGDAVGDRHGQRFAVRDGPAAYRQITFLENFSTAPKRILLAGIFPAVLGKGNVDHRWHSG